MHRSSRSTHRDWSGSEASSIAEPSRPMRPTFEDALARARDARGDDRRASTTRRLRSRSSATIAWSWRPRPQTSIRTGSTSAPRTIRRGSGADPRRTVPHRRRNTCSAKDAMQDARSSDPDELCHRTTLRRPDHARHDRPGSGSIDDRRSRLQSPWSFLGFPTVSFPIGLGDRRTAARAPARRHARCAGPRPAERRPRGANNVIANLAAEQ